MNTKSHARLSSLFLVAVFCVVVCWWSWKEHNEMSVLRASSERGSGQSLAYRSEIDRLKREVDELQKAAAINTANGFASETAKIVGGPPGAKSVDLRPFISKDPAYAELRRRAFLRSVQNNYGDLRKLNLQPDQLDKLTNLLIDKMEAPKDARDAALQIGMKDGSAEMNNAIGNALRDVEDQIQTSLGSTSYEELQKMAGFSVTETNLQMGIGKDLEAAGLPLSHEQLAALAEAETAAPAASQEAQDQAYRARAAAVLSPDQLAVFNDGLAFQQDQDALIKRSIAAAKQQFGEFDSYNWNFP